MKSTVYPYWQFLDMMQNATDKNNVSAIITLALGQWKSNTLSTYQLAGLLSYAGEKITTIKK